MEIKEIFKSDRAILIACILLSGIFWLMNKMSQPVDWERDITLKYVVPEGYVFAEPPRKSLTFTAEGSGWKMLALSRKDLDSLLINIPARPGNHTWNNEQLRQMIKDENLGEDINIPKVTPFRLSISLTEASKRCYSVDLPKRITYTSGFQNIQPIQVDPDSICITGPAEYLTNTKSWPVDSLILNNVSEDRKGTLQVLNEHPSLLQIVPERVSYSLEVAEFTELKKYSSIKVINNTEKDSISLFPSRALVSMQIPLDRYEQARNQEVNLFVNVDKEQKGSNVISVQIPDNIPEWMKNVQVNPSSVEFYYISRDTIETAGKQPE